LAVPTAISSASIKNCGDAAGLFVAGHREDEIDGTVERRCADCRIRNLAGVLWGKFEDGNALGF
jgi:hypothetical protein